MMKGKDDKKIRSARHEVEATEKKNSIEENGEIVSENEGDDIESNATRKQKNSAKRCVCVRWRQI